MSSESTENTSKHFSDIDTWKYPDRNYYLFITLSILFGFFGIDHFYLRSFGTGMQKLLVNIFTLGMWYFWDIIQIMCDGKKIRIEGLDSPFDWIRGIGRGVFVDPKERLKMLNDPSQPIIRTKKDIVIYALLTIMFGIFGFDKIYMGHPWQAAGKFLSTVNITFLFGLMWIVWDIVHVVFYTESFLKDGVTIPMPFSFLFSNFPVNDLFIPEKLTKQQLNDEGAKQPGWFSSLFGSKPTSGGGEVKGEVKDETTGEANQSFLKETINRVVGPIAGPIASDIVEKALGPSFKTFAEIAEKDAKIVSAAAGIGKELLSTVPEVASSLTQKIAELSDPTTLMAKIQAQAATKASARMQGGYENTFGSESAFGSENNFSPDSVYTNESAFGPIIAGTLSAIVLVGFGMGILEVVSK